MVPIVSIADVADDLPAGVMLLDVREDEEWVAGHAPNAVHIPLSELVKRLGEVPKDGDVYVICRTGGRSARVTEYLNNNGWTAANVDGGMWAWSAAGRPLVCERAGAEPGII